MEIFIKDNVYRKVMHWVKKADIEVSGFGKVIYDVDSQAFEVVEAYLIDQEGGASHTDICDKALGKLMFESKDDPGTLRWWWHSHVNMAVFWSSTDRKTIEELGSQGWIVASVFNKKEEVRSALCYTAESMFGKTTQLQDDVTTTIECFVDPDEIAQWDLELAKKVKPKTYASTFSESNWGVGDKAWDREDHKPASIISLGNEKNTPPIAYKTEDADKDAGLTGAGLGIEAAALGMTLADYVNALNYASYNELALLEDKLWGMVETGKLNFGVGETYEPDTV